jgi:polyisoprenoid-binding protein YceI
MGHSVIYKKECGMSRIAILATPMVLIGGLAAVAPAAETYKVDPVHSAVIFRIKHLNVSYSYGRFNDPQGTFVFDDDEPASCSFDIKVRTRDVDTNNAERDKHLRGEVFFDVKQFPYITFKSTQVTKSGEDTYKVAGDMTFHGVTRPITVEVQRTGAGPDPWGTYRSGFETVFTIKRSDFGMDAMLETLGDEVRLFVSLEGVRQNDE